MCRFGPVVWSGVLGGLFGHRRFGSVIGSIRPLVWLSVRSRMLGVIVDSRSGRRLDSMAPFGHRGGWVGRRTGWIGVCRGAGRTWPPAQCRRSGSRGAVGGWLMPRAGDRHRRARHSSRFRAMGGVGDCPKRRMTARDVRRRLGALVATVDVRNEVVSVCETTL